MQAHLKAVCQMIERNNGIFRALFTCQQKLSLEVSQEETVLVNLRLERGMPVEGKTYRISIQEEPENGR